MNELSEAIVVTMKDAAEKMTGADWWRVKRYKLE